MASRRAIDIQWGHPPALVCFASLTALPAVVGFVVMKLVQDARNAKEVRQALKLDARIAACARGLSATLYTFNDKHYRVVPGLVTAAPYTRWSSLLRHEKAQDASLFRAWRFSSALLNGDTRDGQRSRWE